MKSEIISYKNKKETSGTASTDSKHFLNFFLDIKDIKLESLSANKSYEISKNRILKYADNIYKNYILINKIDCFKESNLTSNPVLFINCVIAIKIINSLKLNKKKFILYNQILKTYLKSQNHNIDNEILFYLDYNSLSNLSKTMCIDINADDINKIIKLINLMDLDNVIDLEKENLNKILGLVFEKFITKKEIGAYYTGENTTTYITENSLIASVIKNWSKDDKNLDAYLNLFEKENKISLTEYAISKNISLKKILFHLIKEFDSIKLNEIITKLTIIDISCGSGSFIFSAYFLINEIIQKTSTNKYEFLPIDLKIIYLV